MFQATGLILNATTPSPFIDRREVVALLRGPAANPTQYLATQDWLRLGQWHNGGRIAKLPEPQDARSNDFGSQESGSTSIEIPVPDNNAARVVALDNLAISLDGLNDYISIPDTAALKYTGGYMSIECLYMLDQTDVDRAYLLSKPWNGSGEYNYMIEVTAPGTARVVLYGATAFFGATFALPVGTPFRLALVLRPDKSITVAVDNEVRYSNAHAITNWTPGAGNLNVPLAIGAIYPYGVWAGNTDLAAKMIVDDLRIWTVERSLADIVKYGRRRLRGDETGLVGYYKFDEPTGTVVNDASPSANHGSLVNGPTRVTGIALDAIDEHMRSPALLKNQPVDLDLITRRTRLDGSQVDFINERRGTVKAVTRTPSALKLTIVDIDREAMKTMLPAETYTVANFPKLYTDHVNRPVIDCVGTNEKLSCTYIDNTPGAFKYAVCRQRTGQALPTVLTVYRGKSAGKGQIVPAAEYVVGSTLVAGVTYVTLTFTREQSDGNQLYEIEADVLGAGSRNVIDEIAYVLGLIGISIDTPDFTDAAQYHASIGTMIDACYRQQISAQSILDNLTRIARGWLAQSVTGLYSIFVDRPRTASLMLWDDSDQVQVDELSDPEIPKTITVRYRPRPGSRSDYSGDLSRTTAGASGEEIVTLEYVRDHAVADRYADYLAKRRARPRARATVYGRVLQPGELVAINSPLVFDGWKQVAATSINRRADACEITGEIYNEADYTYTPGTLPADATNAYTPDYTFTPPTAPTSPTATGAAVTVDATGKAFANVLIRAVPPANNWTRLWVVAKNNVTTAQTAPAELTLNAGNYEVRVGNLEPSVSYSFLMYATNIADLPGAPATVTQTMPTYSASPPTPTGLNWLQQAGDTIVFYCDNPAYAHHDRVEWEVKIGGGSFAVQAETSNRLVLPQLTYGTTYQAKMRFKDKSGNYSAYPGSTLSATPTKQISDSHIASASVSGASISNASINRGRSDTSTGTISGTVANGGVVNVTMGVYSFYPSVYTVDNNDSTGYRLPLKTNADFNTDDKGCVTFENNSGATVFYGVYYRNFNA